ncbi:MAG: flagellar protein FlaG [Planctomycetota bacterium]
MDLDRTSLGERALDPRARSLPTQDPKEKGTADAAPPVAPRHGGALASSRADQETETQPDPDAETRRQKAIESVTRFLSLPGDADLDIEVDTEQSKVTFVIRNRRTGELMYTVPESDAGPLMDQLRQHHGALIDRSF